MQGLITRTQALEEIQIRLDESPAVALLGARQAGKTTLAEEVAALWQGPTRVFDLERSAVKEAMMERPESILADLEGLVIIDEVQRMPELFALLRPLCDARNRKSVFLLLGSASWDLIKGVSESLAGRIQFVDIGGLSITDTGADAQNRLWFRGGFPRAFLAATDSAWDRWMEGFTRTFLEQDIPGLGSLVSPASLGRFWRMLAHYHGQTWNAAELGRSMDMSASAVNHYRDLLAGTFMIRVLPPWYENLGKRLVKSPKVYLRDSGVLHHLLGLGSSDALKLHPRYGASWEGFALEQTLLLHGDRDAYFYGTQAGAELDLLLMRRGKKWGFEFKCSDAPSTTRSMHIARSDLGLEHLWVIYPGTLRYSLAEGITALPLSEVGSIVLA